MKNVKTHSKDINQMAKMVVGIATREEQGKKPKEDKKRPSKESNSKATK